MMRIGWLLTALAIAGCVEFSTTASKPELLPAYDEQRATIEAGKTTRAEVRELLGEPWLASERWGFELYRFSDQIRDIEWVGIPPLPMGAFKREVTAYTLIAWDDDGTVVAVSSGTVVNSYTSRQYSDSMLIRSDRFTLAVQSAVQSDASQQSRIILWADHGQLAPLLQARRESSTCTLVVGCDSGRNCQDFVVGFDDYPPLIQVPAFSPAYESGPCKYHPDCTATLVYPFELAPEKHRLKLRTGYPACSAEAEIEFSCAPGQVLFARLGVDERPYRHIIDCKRTLTAEFVDELPPEWSGHDIVLWRNGNWIAAP